MGKVVERIRNINYKKTGNEVKSLYDNIFFFKSANNIFKK